MTRILLPLLQLIVGLVQSAALEEEPNNCPVPVPVWQENFDNCVDMARDFVSMYLQGLRGEDARALSEYCSETAEISACVMTHQTECPDLAVPLAGSRLDWWKQIERYAEASCISDEDIRRMLDSEKERQCFEDQHQSEFSEWCDLYYTPPDRQNTCQELLNAVECKVRLVETACTVETARMARELYSEEAQLRKRGCQESPGHYDTAMMEYSRSCPVSILDDIRDCEISENKLPQFSSDNPVVLMNPLSRKKFNQYCRNFNRYRQNCLQRVTRRCPKALRVYYDMHPDIRETNQIMDYICRPDIKENYQKFVPCYQRVENEQMRARRCMDRYNLMVAAAEKVTRPEIHCSNSSAVKKFKKYLTNLRMCTSAVYNESCGNAIAADILDPLLDMAYTKHELLGLKPFCQGQQNTRDQDRGPRWSTGDNLLQRDTKEVIPRVFYILFKRFPYKYGIHLGSECRDIPQPTDIKREIKRELVTPASSAVQTKVALYVMILVIVANSSLLNR